MCKIQIKKNWIAVSENDDSFTIRTTSIKETASRSRSSRSTTFQIVAYQTNSTSNLTLSLWISTCVDLFAYWILISSTTRSAFTNDPSPFDVSVSTSQEIAVLTTFFQLANKPGMTHFQVCGISVISLGIKSIGLSSAQPPRSTLWGETSHSSGVSDAPDDVSKRTMRRREISGRHSRCCNRYPWNLDHNATSIL